MLVKFEIPRIAPDVIIKVKQATQEANVKFKKGEDRVKKQWIKKQVMPVLVGVKIKKIPTWLEQPIKEAAVSIMVDTIWALQEGS